MYMACDVMGEVMFYLLMDLCSNRHSRMIVAPTNGQVLPLTLNCKPIHLFSEWNLTLIPWRYLVESHVDLQEPV